MSVKGKVYVIGGGPGDPGLITVRGVECLRKADVVVYDYLVGREILDYARKDARLIYVGKKGGDHTVSQDNLNQILVEEAVKGNIIARLKGGDPFIFGRGGEEAQVLAQAGIPFEVVPGVTSAIAVPAYAAPKFYVVRYVCDGTRRPCKGAESY
jgi:uroporphyrinogen III methyltransferase/synthase